MLTILAFSLSAFVSGMFCYLTFSTQQRHIQWTGDTGQAGPQKLHHDAVPRIGGIALILGVAAGASPIIGNYNLDWVPLTWIFLPCVVAGFADDITHKIPPLVRYVATLASACLFCLYYGVWIKNLGLEWLNLLFFIPGFGLLFTVFAIGSVAHAFNLIDGQNGLCSGVATIASISTGIVAYQTGENSIFWLSGLCATANIGFLVFNYPHGRIFLGDSGAYFNGAFVGALLVWLTANQPEVSPWLALNILMYPVWETLFSMARRIKQGNSISAPDTEHLHSLIYKKTKHTKTLLAKSSAPAIWLGYGAICWLAVEAYSDTHLQIGISATFIFLYGLAYRFAKQTLNNQIKLGLK